MMIFRLDSIKSVKVLDKTENIEKLKESAKRFDSHHFKFVADVYDAVEMQKKLIEDYKAQYPQRTVKSC